MKPTRYVPSLALALVMAACNDYTAPGPVQPAFATFEVLGDSAAIAGKLAEFRTALGGTLNAPGSAPATTGRREINWDGSAPALTNVDTFPANFFNVNSKRGVVFTTPGTGFRVDSSLFGSVNLGLTGQFVTFSPRKLFMPVGSNVMDVHFQLAGTTTPALVTAFGAVFTDVDRKGSTRLEFFDAQDVKIGEVVAPNHSGSRELSFTGAMFASAIIARVRITCGDAPLTATGLDISGGGGGNTDLVAMDDFIYGEPRVTP